MLGAEQGTDTELGWGMDAGGIYSVIRCLFLMRISATLQGSSSLPQGLTFSLQNSSPEYMLWMVLHNVSFDHLLYASGLRTQDAI